MFGLRHRLQAEGHGNSKNEQAVIKIAWRGQKPRKRMKKLIIRYKGWLLKFILTLNESCLELQQREANYNNLL